MFEPLYSFQQADTKNAPPQKNKQTNIQASKQTLPPPPPKKPPKQNKKKNKKPKQNQTKQQNNKGHF